VARISFTYTIKVWITSAVLSPFLIVMLNNIFSLDVMVHFVVGSTLFIFLAIFFGLIFSIPALILFTFLNWLLARTQLSNRQKKFILCPVSSVLAGLTLYIIYGKPLADIEIDFILLLISYPAVTLTSSIFYSLKPNTTP
jgi:hypothetical protein